MPALFESSRDALSGRRDSRRPQSRQSYTYQITAVYNISCRRLWQTICGCSTYSGLRMYLRLPAAVAHQKNNDGYTDVRRRVCELAALRGQSRPVAWGAALRPLTPALLVAPW